MPGILVREGQSVEIVLKLLKRQVEKSGVMQDLKTRRHFEKPSIKKKKKSTRARKRLAKLKRKMES